MFAVAQQILLATAPVFIMLLVGIVLRRLEQVDDHFVNVASRLVFNFSMPVMLFLAIAQTNIDQALKPALLGYFLLGTLASFAIAWLWAMWRVAPAERGIYVQGAFRGNNGIIGIALCSSLYGDYGLSAAGVLAGVMIVSYNALSAIVLGVYSAQGRQSAGKIALGIAKNPLIIGVVSALPFAYWQISLPQWLSTSGHYLAQLTMPLALICIGATLSLASMRASSALALSSSLMKVLWLPLLATCGAIACGFRGADLGILFLYFVSPTAAASYVMARAMGGNHQLAAAIIAISTVLAVITINGGLFILMSAGLA